MNQKIIDKIKKLLALGTSNNENESAAAMAAAQRLMIEHEIEAATLDDPPDEEWSNDPSELFRRRTSASVPTWVVRLSGGLQNEFPSIVSIGLGRLTVVGKPSNVRNLRTMFNFAVSEITRLARRHPGKGRAWLNEYREGCVDGFLKQLRETRIIAYESARKASAGKQDALDQINRAAARHQKDFAEANSFRSPFGGYWRGGSGTGKAYTSGFSDGASMRTRPMQSLGAGNRGRLTS